MATAVMASTAGESLAPLASSPQEEECRPSQLTPSSSRPSSSSTGRSPRCEAFVMTGDKILNLTPHISPSYAKVAREQLPPRMSIHESPRSHSAIADMHFPSSKRGRFRSSVSQPEGVTLKERVEVNPLRFPVDEEPITADKEDDSRMKEEQKERRESTEQPPPPTMLASTCSRTTASNPAMGREDRTASSDTFILSTESPTKMSSVTVNGIHHCQMREEDSGGFSQDVSVAGRTTVSAFPPFPAPSTSTTPTRSNSLSCRTAQAVLSHWAATRIDVAMREFLAQVELKGETSQRERILMHFSRRYYQANTTSFSNFDEVHGLACGLLLLNADLHNPEISRKMTCREFVNNMAHTGHDYPKPLLKTLYQSIKENALAFNKSGMEEEGKRARKAPTSRSVLSLQVDPRKQIEYKRGFLMRKVVYESDGTPTPLGRRGWRELYVRLRGLALYFSRDETEPPLYSALSGSISLHHSLADSATDYTKRKYVFRLRTAGMGEVLFQTSSETELSSWVQSMNVVAASFSSRALPPALDSRGTISWPRLPRQPAAASLEDQVAAHESSATALRDELQRLQRNAPPVRARGRPVEKYFFNERLLMHEIHRYETYSSLLRARLDRNSSDSGILSKASNAAEEAAERLSYREAIQVTQQ